MGRARDLFKKIGDFKETFYARMSMIKDRNGKDLTETEEIKKRLQEYTELYKKGLKELFQILKDDAGKCCTQYASKFRKLSRGHRTEKGQFSFQFKRKTMPRMFKLPHNYTHLTR